MAEPNADREELERLRKKKRLQELEQKRIAARSARNGQTPDFNRPVDPAKQQGLINTALTNPLDRFQEEIKNFDPRPDAGINHPMDAFLFKGINALTGGAVQSAGNDVVPGANLGDRAVRASDSYPVAAAGGQMTGMGAQIFAGGHALAPLKNLPLVKPVVDTVGKTRLGSYAGRMAKDVGLWTGESALQGATTIASENAAYTGEKPTMSDRANMAGQMATMDLGDAGVKMPFVKDIPLNVLGPVGASIARRTGTAIATQGASVTPQHVRKSVQSGTGRISGGPEQMRAVAEIIDAELAGGLRPQAIAAVHRLLKGSGLSTDDVTALNREVRNRLEAGAGAGSSRKTVGQLYSEILDDPEGPLYKPQASLNIIATLRERRMNASPGDGSAGVIGSTVRDIRDSQKGFLEDSAQQNLGSGTRIGVREQVEATRKDISAEYERILAAAPRSGPGADTLRALVLADPSKNSVLRRKAKNAGLSVDEYVTQNPYAAAHWMRSRLSKDARSASGREKGDLLDTVEQLDEVLDGFDSYAQTKRNWGTEQGVLDARDFGKSLFGGPNAVKMNDPGLRAELVEEFKALSPREQEVALISIRDSALGRMQGGPKNQQARITALTSDAAIDFFEQVGAKRFSDDLMLIKKEQGFHNLYDSDAQSRTAPNQAAISQSPDLYGSTLSNAVRADGQGMGVIPIELAASQFAPGLSGWYAAYRGMKAAANKAFDLRNSTKEDMTRFLMSRANLKGSTSELPMKNITPPKGGSTPPTGGAPSGGAPAAGAATSAGSPPPGAADLPMKGDTKQGYSNKDKAVDAAALGVASGGFVGPADAEGIDYETKLAAVDQDLQRAQTERAATLRSLQTAQEELAAWNARFNAEDRDVMAIQTFLRDNVNPQLRVDGDPRGNTATANQEYVSRLEQAIALQQEALARNDTAIQEATGRRADLETQQAYDAGAPNPAWDFVRDKLPWLGAAAGIAAGYRTRGGNVRKMRQKAEAVEGQVEGLLKPNRGAQALSKDANATNQIYELGGSNDKVPFRMLQSGAKQGQPAVKSGAADLANLFPKGAHWNNADFAGAALWGLEGSAGYAGTMYAQGNLEKAETRLETLLDAEKKDLAAIKKARSDVEFWKSARAVGQLSQMVGMYGAGGSLLLGAKGRLPTAQPPKNQIANKRDSVAQRIQKRDEEYRNRNR